MELVIGQRGGMSPEPLPVLRADFHAQRPRDLLSLHSALPARALRVHVSTSASLFPGRINQYSVWAAHNTDERPFRVGFTAAYAGA
mgnify:CR=1 FL=1